jgi:hypothetical protein
MPDSNDPPRTLTAPRLLRGAALLFAVLGGAFLVWVGNQWIEYPEMRASQFGFQAPLWPALGAFVLVAVGAVVALFWTAADRVETGEDLFAQRHRRRASDSSNRNESSE